MTVIIDGGGGSLEPPPPHPAPDAVAVAKIETEREVAIAGIAAETAIELATIEAETNGDRQAWQDELDAMRSDLSRQEALLLDVTSQMTVQAGLMEKLMAMIPPTPSAGETTEKPPEPVGPPPEEKADRPERKTKTPARYQPARRWL